MACICKKVVCGCNRSFSPCASAPKRARWLNAQLALEEAIEELLRLVQQSGGSMEYTHGVGVKLAPLMVEEHGYGLQVMRQIKQALDPNNVLNPGKMGL